jgi:hypothetical protein
VINLRATHPWMFRLNPLIGLLSLLACYMLGRQVFGHWPALIGAGLLSLNMAQIWYARLTMAEILFQFFLLGGLAAAAEYIRRPGRVSGLAAGLALGIATLTKVDGLVALAVLIAVAVLVWPQRDRWPAWGWLAAPLVALTAHYGLHSLLFSGIYFSTNTGTLFRNPTLLLLGLAGLLALGGWVGLRLRYRQRFDALARRPWPKTWRIAVVLAALLAAAYAYFLRPLVLADEAYYHPVWNAMVSSQRGGNFVMLVAYLTPLGAGLAIAGLARHVLGSMRAEHLPFLAVLAGYAVIFTYNAFIVADQPFWVRRFLPVVIPGALLAAGAALAALWRSAARWRLLAPALLAGLATWSIWISLPILGTQTGAGLTARAQSFAQPAATTQTGAGLGAQVQAFASQFPPNAVVVFQDWNAGFSLAAPLEIVYGREVYQLQGKLLTGLRARKWEAQLKRWQDAGRPVFYVANTLETTIPESGWRWKAVGSNELRYPVLETTQARLPRLVAEARQELTVHQLIPNTVQPPCLFWQEIADEDYGTLGPGWYASEQFGVDQPGRWSQPAASIMVPMVGDAQPLTITLNLGNLRPEPPLTSTIEFWTDKYLIAEQPLQPGFANYTFVVPAEDNAATMLEFEVPGWSPGGDDPRQLGVAGLNMLVEQSRCGQP